MNIITERGYVKEIQELFEPFFALHPTKDLNELSTKLTEEYAEGWSISTSIRTTQKEERLHESMDLGFSTRTNEVTGFYSIGCIGVNGKERYCQLDLTTDGAAVRSDGRQTGITEADHERIEKFKFLFQLFDFNKDVFEDIRFEVVEFAERNSHKREGEPYSRDKRSFRYSLNYELGVDHELIGTLRKYFDIEGVLKKEHVKCEISFTGDYTVNDSDEPSSHTMQKIRVMIGDFDDEGAVSISQDIRYDQAISM